jgi:hypothetical protein
MDGPRFDRFTRTFTNARSRRETLASLLGGTLGLVGLTQTEAKKKKPCPPCKKRKHGKCKITLSDGAACTGGTCQGGRCVLATCSDGAKNGSESDVDCGGSCPRCANGKRCVTSNDCTNACKTGTCQACTTTPECGSDGDGQCSCDTRLISGETICTSQNGRGSAQSCVSAGCAAGTVCIRVSVGEARCFKPCGA